MQQGRMEYIDLVPPIPLPSTNHLMLGRTGSKKGIITRVMVGYTGSKQTFKGCGRIKHAPQTVPVGGNSTFFFLLTRG